MYPFNFYILRLLSLAPLIVGDCQLLEMNCVRLTRVCLRENKHITKGVLTLGNCAVPELVSPLKSGSFD